MMEFLATLQQGVPYIYGSALIIFGIAILLHIRKEPNDAHGKNRT
jgi:hypothetical protein